MQVLVVGMHRSGTSAVARLLNLMGLYFGPEGSSTGLSNENPKGFWERRDVRDLNDKLLTSAGADWDRPSKFQADRIGPTVLTHFEREARNLVLDLDAHRPWFIKEPRLCLTLQQWESVLERPFVVLVHRRPEEVALSLKARNNMPLEVGLALWERYTVDAIRMASHLPKCIISYNALMERPLETASKLFESLADHSSASLRRPNDQDILSFIDPKLHRQRGDDKTRSLLSRAQRELVAQLEQELPNDSDHKPVLSKESKTALLKHDDIRCAAEEKAREQAALNSAVEEVVETHSRILAGLERLEQKELQIDQRLDELGTASIEAKTLVQTFTEQWKALIQSVTEQGQSTAKLEVQAAATLENAKAEAAQAKALAEDTSLVLNAFKRNQKQRVPMSQPLASEAAELRIQTLEAELKKQSKKNKKRIKKHDARKNELEQALVELESVRNRYHAVLELHEAAESRLAQEKAKTRKLVNAAASKAKEKPEPSPEHIAKTVDPELELQNEALGSQNEELRALHKRSVQRLRKSLERQEKVESVLRDMESSKSWRLAKLISKTYGIMTFRKTEW